MQLRLATIEDLPSLQVMYSQVVTHMLSCGLEVWDEYYPVAVLDDDIALQRLYVLVDGESITGAFAVCVSDEAVGQVSWSGKSIYLERLVVAMEHRGKGLGVELVKHALRIATLDGCQSLRLLVVQENVGAIKLYEACGFDRIDGMYDLVLEDGSVLHEIGYEKRIG